MGIAMLGGMVALTGLNMVVPPLVPTVLAGIAIVVAFCSVYAVRLEQTKRLSTGQRMSLMGLVIGLPMMLYGSAIGLLAMAGLMPWLQCLAVLVTISLLASVTGSGRLAGVLVAQIAMWSGVTCVASRIGGFTTLAIGTVITVIAFLRQRQIERLAQGRPKRRSACRPARRSSSPNTKRPGRAGSGKPTGAGN
jgi:hypothetical protein